MKHTISRLDAKHVEDVKVVMEYREGHLQSVLQSISVRQRLDDSIEEGC